MNPVRRHSSTATFAQNRRFSSNALFSSTSFGGQVNFGSTYVVCYHIGYIKSTHSGFAFTFLRVAGESESL